MVTLSQSLSKASSTKPAKCLCISCLGSPKQHTSAHGSARSPPCVNMQTVLPFVEFLTDETHLCLHLLGPALTPAHTDACPRHILAFALDPCFILQGAKLNELWDSILIPILYYKFVLWKLSAGKEKVTPVMGRRDQESSLRNQVSSWPFGESQVLILPIDSFQGRWRYFISQLLS